MSFDDIKTFNGMKYSDMSIGGAHHWDDPYGVRDETKVAPDRWRFKFTSLKRRQVAASVGSHLTLNHHR